MTTLNGNIFKQAKSLLRSKSIFDMSEEELTTVKAAMIPLDILPEFNDKTRDEGLEYLARLYEGNGKQGGGISQRSKKHPPGEAVVNEAGQT